MTCMVDKHNICFTYVLHMFHICFTHVSHMFYICFTYVLHMFHICFTYVLHMFHICFTYVPHMFDIFLHMRFLMHCFNVYLAGYLWACYRVEVLSFVQSSDQLGTEYRTCTTKPDLDPKESTWK